MTSKNAQLVVKIPALNACLSVKYVAKELVKTAIVHVPVEKFPATSA
jgi:hypothetical protein